jgi:hypothetical protein
MLWASAKRAGVRYLVTEDFQDGFVLHGVTFINPFHRQNDQLIDENLAAALSGRDGHFNAGFCRSLIVKVTRYRPWLLGVSRQRNFDQPANCFWATRFVPLLRRPGIDPPFQVRVQP